MRTVHNPAIGSRRGVVATTVTGVLAISGLICVGIALIDRQYPSQSLRNAPARTVPGQTPTSHPPRAGIAPQTDPSQTPAAAPLTLVIPAIGVQSPLQHLGLNTDGSLETPAPGPHYDEAGWYRYSPTPGSLGPSIIVGHLDSAANGPSVFFRLAALRQGDTVLITRADGSVAVFAVDEVHRYPKQRFPTQRVYGNTDHAALRLITCGGVFDRANGHYLDNIVVMASLIRTSRAAAGNVSGGRQLVRYGSESGASGQIHPRIEDAPQTTAPRPRGY
jgi:hypothetical protein